MIIAIHGLGDRPESFSAVLQGFDRPARVIVPRGLGSVNPARSLGDARRPNRGRWVQRHSERLRRHIERAKRLGRRVQRLSRRVQRLSRRVTRLSRRVTRRSRRVTHRSDPLERLRKSAWG